MKISNKYVLFIIFSFIVLTSINSCYSVIHAENSYSWKTTTGAVVKSSVIKGSNNVPDQLVFLYTYTVNNKIYTSNNVIVPPSILVSAITKSSPNSATDFSSQHPAGSSITVYYNPQNPSEATIENGLSLSHFMDLGYFLIVLISFIVAVFTFKKNPFFSDITGVLGRIILTQFLSILVVGISLLYLMAFLLCNIFLFIIILDLAYMGLFTIAIFLKIIQQTFQLSNLFFESGLILLFIGSLVVFFLFLKKGVKSLLVKYNQNFIYFTTGSEIRQNIDTGKWGISVKGYYNKLDKQTDFSHTVKKEFQSKSKAERFYEKHIKQDYDLTEKRRGFLWNKKTLYILNSKNETYKQEILLNYPYYGYLRLFLSLSFLLVLDYMIFVLFGIKSATLSFLIDNIFNRIAYMSTFQNLLSNSLLVDIIIAIGITELLFSIFTFLTGVKIFYKKIYKVYVYGEEGRKLLKMIHME